MWKKNQSKSPVTLLHFVAHWKANHYAALLEEQNGLLHIKDPPFGGDLWVSRQSLLVSLNLTDTPVGYTPPKGPPVNFTATYNQREANQPANFTYSNLGAKWTFNWLTYLEDDPANAARDILRYAAGGGVEIHTGYTTATQTFAPRTGSQSVLVRTASNPLRYELRWPDGSVDVFAQPDGHTVYPRKIFLTEKRDPQGNTVSLAYDADLRITRIADALGQQTQYRYAKDNTVLEIAYANAQNATPSRHFQYGNS